MPRLGAEPLRKRSLVEAAINMIGEQGSLDVSVKNIATRAGMSSGLAFHYFGDKEQIVTEAMRHLIRELTRDFSLALAKARTPRERIEAIVTASFGTKHFDRRTFSAWLVLYCHAQRSQGSARLHQIYTRRLSSNLLAPLLELQPRERAVVTADMLAALIDGLYIRQALNPSGADPKTAISLCNALLTDRLLATNSQ